MHISYDPEVDALYIRLIDGPHQCQTVCVTNDVILNIGEGETLVGIEVLDAKRTLGHTALASILENIPAISS